MPELPEVETMRLGASPLVGRRLVSLRQCRCRAKPITIEPSLPAIRRRIVGQTLVALDRLGKRIVLVFERGDRLVIEPRMTGLLVISDPPARKYLRLVLEFSGPAPDSIWFWDRRGLGTVRWYSPDCWQAFLDEGRVGPDALKISQSELRQRLAHSRTAIKVALLDQRKLGGIGNLYASEILHRSHIDPRRACLELSDDEWRRLWRVMRRVLREAIQYEGSTLSDGTYRNALNQSGNYQNHHRVYAKAGRRCPTCGRAEIVRIVQCQRSTFFCPRCQ